VIDQLGWDSETHGHMLHGIRHHLLKADVFYRLNSFINGRRRE